MQPESFYKLLSDNRLVFTITLALALLLAWQMSLLAWQALPLPAMPSLLAPGVMVEHSSNANQSLNLAQKIAVISRAELFGKVRQKTIATVAPVEVKDAPQSTLNYKLRGIYFSDDKALASVILQKNNRDTKFYRLGDEIDKDIYIRQINEDYILISRQGRLEKLLLEKPKMNARTARGAGYPAYRSGYSLMGASRVLQSYKRRYIDNPMALAKRFQAIPVAENGRTVGYKLRALRGERLLQKIGLQPNDVFIAVNGIGLDKPFQALDALKSLTTANHVSLTILRNGNRQTFDYNLNP